MNVGARVWQLVTEGLRGEVSEVDYLHRRLPSETELELAARAY